ncbi:MAG: hypothetical protein K0S65_6800 [Labilithrix sp.]|nr:hypothetical protein [Labilithrix sp.]
MNRHRVGFDLAQRKHDTEAHERAERGRLVGAEEETLEADVRRLERDGPSPANDQHLDARLDARLAAQIFDRGPVLRRHSTSFDHVPLPTIAPFSARAISIELARTAPRVGNPGGSASTRRAVIQLGDAGVGAVAASCLRAAQAREGPREDRRARRRSSERGGACGSPGPFPRRPSQCRRTSPR